jgi:hypothetical protein
MSAYPFYDDTGEDWPFCECGVTLLDGEDQCNVCANAPHHRECDCNVCVDYWDDIAKRSKIAAERAGRALVCTCGWTGAFIEHHNSEAYGTPARAFSCVITYRDPVDGRQQLVRKAWNGSEWRQVGEEPW